MSTLEIQSISKKQTITIILLIITSGLGIRLFFYPYDIPISLDAIDYFSYSIAVAKDYALPGGYIINKFGWPIFLSPFFMIGNFVEMSNFMDMQRVLSIIISTITFIPLFYFIKNFFKKEVAIICSTLFVFNPKIIENSLLGVADPLFILCIICAIMFTFINNSKYYYFSYVFASFAFIVRQEGILLVIPLILFFIIKKNYSIPHFIKLGIGLALFVIIVVTAELVIANDVGVSIFDTIINAGNISEQEIIINNDNNTVGTITDNNTEFIQNSIFNYFKFLGWILLPNFIFFIFLSIIITKKKISKNKIIVLLFIVFLSLTSLFAYGKGIQDVRYLFPLIPLFALFSGYSIHYIYLKLKKKAFLLIIPIIISSGLLLTATMDDYTFQKESFDDALKIVQIVKGVNNYENNKFVKVAVMHHNWPDLLPYGENKKIMFGIDKFRTENYAEIKEFIFDNYEKGLTHIVVYQKNNVNYLNDVFNNEDKFVYLEKIYDFKENENLDRMKIFQINYDKFITEYEK